MRILIINHSDQSGGASQASMRLMHALNRQGVATRMLVADRQTGDPDVDVLESKWRHNWNFVAERLGVMVRNGFSRESLFKIDPAWLGTDLSHHPRVAEADVIVLAWVNQGMLSLGQVARLAATGKPVVWIMHDMWNCTGVCHYAYDCTNYHGECRHCPVVGRDYTRLALATQRRKARLYASTDIRFVAVSNWLADCCRDSSLMGGLPVEMISNPMPCSRYAWQRDNDDSVEAGKVVMVMGAARLDDPVKGFDVLIDTTRHIANHRPDLARRLHLLLYGDIRQEALLAQIAVDYTHLGYRSDINDVLRKADILLSTARYESFGYTIVEGMASGCTPVVAGLGGQTDIVTHLTDGYLARSLDPEQITRGIEWAIEARLDRKTQHERAVERFDDEKIAGRFISLFESLIKKSR